MKTRIKPSRSNDFLAGVLTVLSIHDLTYDVDGTRTVLGLAGLALVGWWLWLTRPSSPS